MTDLPKRSSPESFQLQQVVRLLGGDRIVRRRLNTPLDVHEVLVRGLLGTALLNLMKNLVVVHSAASLEQAIGMSVRTIQRRKKRAHAIPPRQAPCGLTWKFG